MSSVDQVTPEVSVIICTHNPREAYLRRVVAALQDQSFPRARWELLLVDNCSSTPVAQMLDLSWHPQADVVREDRLGLTPARLRGIRDSKGDLLVFVDDDNVLERDFLETAVRVAAEKPFLGSWSGQCHPEFEAPPPQWTRRYWGSLVLREFEHDKWSNQPRLAETMPCGAGLCVRRAVAQVYLDLHESGQRPDSLDRAGSSLLSGGDNDLAACACDLGLGVGLISGLSLTHLLPPERLTVDYLTRLAEGIYFSSVMLAHLRGAREELNGYRIRWHEPLRAALRRGPHGRIARAAIRGRRLGFRWIAGSS